jgi:SH3-like domain-containing protein
VIPQVVVWLFILLMGAFSMMGKSIAFVTQEAELRKTPLESAFVDTKIPIGTRVRIVDRAGKFLKIEQSGNSGWVEKKSLYIFKSGN